MSCALEKKLQGFQLIAQEKLQAIICSIPGTKDLILEKSLIKPLEHICAPSYLKLKGIQRIFKFEPGNEIPYTENVQIIMLRSMTFQYVLAHVSLMNHQETARKNGVHALKQYHLVCVPSCFYYYQSLLEKEGLCGQVQLHRFNWDFIYLDDSLLCMELPNIFATTFIQQNNLLLPAIAQSLRVLQMVCGRPDFLLTSGDQSANIVKMLNALGPWRIDDAQHREFSGMIIIDRDRDYVATLLTPAIYAGLLLEIFNCQAGEIIIDSDVNKVRTQKLPIFLPTQHNQKMDIKATNTDKSQQTVVSTIRMNSLHDEIYGENCYKHFAQTIVRVRAQAKVIGLEVHKLNEMKLEQIHDYVARTLPKISELKTKTIRHLKASEAVIEMLAANFRKLQALEEELLNNVTRKRTLIEIDEMLTTEGQRYNALRLICLMHLCGGVNIDELTTLVRNYCNFFGAQNLQTFQQLTKAGLLPSMKADEKLLNKSKLLANLSLSKFQQTEFQANANRLKLVVSSTGGPEPSAMSDNSIFSTEMAGLCPSYVFNGTYIPLVAQLCSLLLKFNSADDITAKLGMLDKIQLHMHNNSNMFSIALTPKSFPTAVKQGECNDVFPLRAPSSLCVFILGGATFAEIAACDLVSKTTGTKIIVASDCIISGADLLSSAF